MHMYVNSYILYSYVCEFLVPPFQMWNILPRGAPPDVDPYMDLGQANLENSKRGFNILGANAVGLKLVKFVNWARIQIDGAN